MGVAAVKMTNDETRMTNAMTRCRGDRWLYAFSLAAEEWHGCYETLERCVDEMLRCEPDFCGAAFFALGRKMKKQKCEEHGVEWPWYEVKPRLALRIEFPAKEGAQ
jgi:hypothetical protein